MAVLRVKVLLQSEGSRVSMKCVPGELKLSAILKRDMGDITAVVVLEPEQLLRGVVRVSPSPVGKAKNQWSMSLTWEGHTTHTIQSGWA